MAHQVGVGELFRGNRGFRALYGARLVSLFGDWFNLLAIIALLRELGEDGAGVLAWVLIFKTLPNVLMAPIAGVVADRFSRRSIMIASDLLRFIVVLGFFLVQLYPQVSLLVALVMLQAALGAFFEPARNAILPDIVSDQELTAANTMDAATWSAMLTLGAAAGGLFTAAFGWRMALLVDAGSYLLSFIFMLGVPEVGAPKERAPGPRDLADALGLRDMAWGLRYIRTRPRVLSLALVKSGFCLAGGITLTLTMLGERVYPIFGQPELGVAMFYVARGLGTGVGPFLSRWLAREDAGAMERCIGYGFLCAALFYMALPLAPAAAVAALIVMVAHFGGSTIWVFSTIRLQQLVPGEVRGRVFAAEQACFTSTLAAMTWIYGRIMDSDLLPLPWVPALLGLSLLLATALWALRGWRFGWAGAAARQEAALSAARGTFPGA